MNFQRLSALHNRLTSHYKDRDELFDKVDDHVHGVFNFPVEIPDVSWLRKIKTTDPSDAIQTTVRTYATHNPKFRVTPLANTPPNKTRANEIEQIIRWHWKKASQRAEVKPTWDIVESAARYSMVAGQVVYLPCQFETYKTMGKNSPKAKYALAQSPFVIQLSKPKGIYPQYSDMTLEGVLAVRTQLAEDFVNFWGDRAKDIKKKIKDSETPMYVISWDYTDYTDRTLYAFLSHFETDDASGEVIEVINEPHELPFLPWVVKTWGNTLDSSSKHRVNPMLASIIEADQWATQNILESLGTSLIIQRAAAPIAYDETPSGEGLDTDFSEPATTVHGTSGLTKYTPLPPPQVDSAIAAYTDRFGARMSKATVAKILQNLEFPSGTPYSSVNQILDAAMGAVAPYKLLSQDAISEFAKKMLEWAHFWKDDLTGYSMAREKMGEEYTLKYDEFEPSDLDIEVTLTPYIPIDQVALMNAGILGNKNLKISLGRILEDLGYEDSEAVIAEWEQERQNENAISLGLQQDQMALQLQAEQAKMGMQAQLEQQALAQAAANKSPQSPGLENAEGAGFNPAQAGTPPVQMEAGTGRPTGRPPAGQGLK